MKKSFYVIFAIAILLVTGCGSSGVVGKWRADGYSVDYFYIFNDDNTCAYEMPGGKNECTYEDDGIKLSILFKGNTNASTYEYRIEDNKLIIKDSLGDDVIYIRQ